MVMKMNKKSFIKEISKQTGYDEEKCDLINNIIEDSFIIGKRNKEKTIKRFITELNLDETQSNKLYEIVINILFAEIKNKLKHPLKPQY